MEINIKLIFQAEGRFRCALLKSESEWTSPGDRFNDPAMLKETKSRLGPAQTKDWDRNYTNECRN